MVGGQKYSLPAVWWLHPVKNIVSNSHSILCLLEFEICQCIGFPLSFRGACEVFGQHLTEDRQDRPNECNDGHG